MTTARQARLDYGGPQRTPTDPMRIVTVTSGKGGVGKTSVVVNLAIVLAEMGTRVTVIDADYGLGNVDILLGLEPEYTLEHLLRGKATLAQVLIEGPEGVRVLPAANGAQELTSLTNEQEIRLQLALNELSASTDLLIVDTGSGISDNVVGWLQRATDVLVVTSPDPTAVVDAYAVLKLMARLDRSKETALLVNQCLSGSEALAIHQRLAGATREFLLFDLRLGGYVLRDPLLGEALRQGRPLVQLLPDSLASRCLRRLAKSLHSQARGGQRDRQDSLQLVAP